MNEEIERKIIRQKLKNFCSNRKNFIVTTRFNDITYHENAMYRTKNTKTKCIYCAPEPVTTKIPYDSILFVIEMNNDINKVMGIGIVRNHPRVNKYSIYENKSYGRYTYVGTGRIDRCEMENDEEELMELLDLLCFKGNRHMKRGQGLRSFPIGILYELQEEDSIDVHELIGQMFKKRMKQNKELQKE
jgi:hypothetical protein